MAPRNDAKLVAVALTVALLAGCSLASNNPPVTAPVPAAFETSAPAAAALWPARDWWTAFQVPELDALIGAAEQANPDLGAAAARVAQADAQVRIAGNTLIPSLDLGGDVTRSRPSEATSSSGSTRSIGARTTYSTSLSASYEIDFWGKNRAQLSSAEASALAARFDRQTVALSVVSSLANSFFQIVALQERLTIAQGNLANAEQVLRAIRARLEVGTATALDLAQQESVVAQQRAVIPNLRQQLRQTVNAVAILLGRPPEGFTVAGGSLMGLTIPAVAPGLPSELLTRRPDVQLAEAQLAAADADVVAARASLFPSVQLTGQGGFQSAALGMLLTPGAGFFSLGAGLMQPLLGLFSLQADLDRNRARYIELLEGYRKAVISSFADVENALVAVEQTAESERLQQDVVTVAERAYLIAQARLREGTVDIITVLNTQQTLFQALDARAQARLARLQAAVGLYRALGGGWTAAAVTAEAGS